MDLQQLDKISANKVFSADIKHFCAHPATPLKDPHLNTARKVCSRVLLGNKILSNQTLSDLMGKKFKRECVVMNDRFMSLREELNGASKLSFICGSGWDHVSLYRVLMLCNTAQFNVSAHRLDELEILMHNMPVAEFNEVLGWGVSSFMEALND